MPVCRPKGLAHIEGAIIVTAGFEQAVNRIFPFVAYLHRRGERFRLGGKTIGPAHIVTASSRQLTCRDGQ